MPFQKGNKLSKGGARPNAGRDSEWLKAECQKIIEKYDLIGFLGKVAAGERVEKTVLPSGEVVETPANTKDRLKASEMLLDRKYGRPSQALEHSGEIAGQSRLVFVFDGDNNSKEKQP